MGSTRMGSARPDRTSGTRTTGGIGCRLRTGGIGGRLRAAAIAWGTLLAFAATAPASARAAEDGWTEYRSPKYGFALEIPPGFTVMEEGRTTSFGHQPGADGEGPLEPGLLIYVNWVWMPDVPSDVMHRTNKRSEQQDMSSPDPRYRDLREFDEDDGHVWEGRAYWFKEVDKAAPDEIHRWHAKAWGNQSAYTVGLTGTFGQFGEWGPRYERVVKSFRLIPMEEGGSGG